MDLTKLKKEYSKKKQEIKKRLKEFSEVKNHFYELCFCILTPQSNAYKCDECITILKEKDFQAKEFELESILAKYTRFHKNKSRYLLKFKKDNTKILQELRKLNTAKEKREYLVTNVKGLGLKEASHFLRNTGEKNLAILDRHILRNLVKLKIIKQIPKSLTPKKYYEIEEKFLNFSKDINIPMDELDLLFWSFQTGTVFK